MFLDVLTPFWISYIFSNGALRFYAPIVMPLIHHPAFLTFRTNNISDASGFNLNFYSSPLSIFICICIQVLSCQHLLRTFFSFSLWTLGCRLYTLELTLFWYIPPPSMHMVWFIGHGWTCIILTVIYLTVLHSSSSPFFAQLWLVDLAQLLYSSEIDLCNTSYGCCLS